MSEPRLALIVPTQDRPQCLRRLLDSLARQSVLPAQVIVVDGGATDVASLLGAFSGLNLRYLKSQPPSLTRQKNAASAALEPTISLVGFLDDDLVLEDRALEAMAAFWAQAGPEIGGAGFTLLPEGSRRGLWLKRVFLLDAPGDGRVLRSGYNTPLRPQARAYAAQWLRGGATVWRREVVEAFPFDEWFTGYSYLEDVDHSIRVHRRYRLMMVPQTVAWHVAARKSWRHQFRLGIWQVRNRLYLARKHPELSIGLCLWSLVGQSVLNGTVGIAQGGLRGGLRALGNLVGWVQVGWRRGL